VAGSCLLLLARRIDLSSRSAPYCLICEWAAGAGRRLSLAARCRQWITILGTHDAASRVDAGGRAHAGVEYPFTPDAARPAEIAAQACGMDCRTNDNSFGVAYAEQALDRLLTAYRRCVGLAHPCVLQRRDS